MKANILVCHAISGMMRNNTFETYVVRSPVLRVYTSYEIMIVRPLVTYFIPWDIPGGQTLVPF
jgi:hypothetical protein